MVCVPCFAIPLLLFLWRLIQPFVLLLWAPKKEVEGAKDGTTEDCDPTFLTCPCRPSAKATPEVSMPEVNETDKKEN